MGYVGPIFLNYIITFITNPSPPHGQQNQEYIFASVWLVAYLLRILFDQQAQWNCFAIGAKVLQVMNLAVHDKLMKMSTF